MSISTSVRRGLFVAGSFAVLAAAGLPLGGLAVGQRADFVVVDAESPALLGVPADHLLDALVFSSPGAAIRETFVAGQPVAAPGPAEREAFVRAMKDLWS